MRISTATFYNTGMSSMQRQTEQLLQVQQQIASGRRVMGPSDDPVAAARVLDVSQAQSINEQYGVNAGAAADSLALQESVLGSINDLLQSAHDVVINAGDAVLNQSDRASMGADLRGRYQALLALANSTDGSGQYLFSGYQGGTRPFSEASPGVVSYNGDQGQRLMQISPSRQIAINDPGVDVFQRAKTGNGYFSTQALASNSGAAVMDAGQLLDPAKWNAAGNNKDFTVKFSLAIGVTSYDIIDNVTGMSLLSGLAPGKVPYPRLYTAGDSINLSQSGPPAFDYGARLTLSGPPANGDSFDVKASTHQDVFKTLDELANLLEGPSKGAVLSNGLVRLQNDLENAMENVIAARVSTGVRQGELESVKTAVADRDLQYSQTLSRLQDLDYAKATSDLMQQQVNLQAAQKSFAKVAGLSLFDYL